MTRRPDRRGVLLGACRRLLVDPSGRCGRLARRRRPGPCRRRQIVDAVTTIGWRLSHIAVDNLGTRALCFFGADAAADADMFDPRYLLAVPGSATDAIRLLEETSSRWRDGIAALDDASLARPLGPKGGPFAADPMATLVAHVSRETIHHGGEIGVLRDLYRARYPRQTRSPTAQV